MSTVVDLMAVMRARAELAALVASHPELTSPESCARLNAALPFLLTEPPMSNRLDAHALGSSVTVGVRLPPELLQAVDAEAARLGAAAAYRAVGRSDAVRSMLLRCIAADRAALAPAVLPPPVEAPVARPSHAPARASTPPVATVGQVPRTAPEAPCPSCGEGIFHDCQQCGARTRECRCVVARDGRCEVCALAPVEASPVAVDMIVAPRRPDAAAVRAQLVALQASNTGDAARWTTRAVGERAGVSKNVVNAIVSGRSVRPEGLTKVAAVLPQ